MTFNYSFQNKWAARLTALILTFTLAMGSALAQAPEAFNYQAALRDASGQTKPNQPVDFRFTIFSGSGASTKVYEEKHSTTTDGVGLVNLSIGDGTVLSGTFSAIDWAGSPHHLKVEVDTGAGYVNMGTMELLSVPYALAAKKVSDMQFSDLDDFPSGTPQAGQVLRYDGSAWVLDSVSDSDEQQLSLSGQVLTISKGNSINLPPAKIYGNGAGLVLVNDTFHADTSAAIWNARKLMGRSLAGGTPSDSSVLQWNATTNRWEMIKLREGQWMENGTGDIYYNTGKVGVGTSTPQSNLSISGADDALRLQGTKGTGSHGARLSFGNDTSAFIEEYADNKLKMHSAKAVIQANSFAHVDSSGNPFITVGNNSWGQNELIVYGDNQSLNSLIGSYDHNGGYIAIFDSVNQKVVELTPNGTGAVRTYGPSGTRNVEITSFPTDGDDGRINLYDSRDSLQIILNTWDIGGGRIETKGPGGSQNVILSSVFGNNDNGYIGVRNASSWTRASMEVAANGGGYLSTRGANGNFNFQLGSAANADEPRFTMHDSAGVVKVEGFVHTTQTGILGTYGPNGNRNVRMTSTTATPDNGILDVSNETGLPDVSIRSNQGSGGTVFTYGPSGYANVGLTSLSADNNNGYIALYDSLGLQRQSSLILASGEGYVETRGPSGNRNASITTLLNYSDNGYVAVDDASGNTQAGIYVDASGQGVVFGDIKNFRMPHPSNEDKEIWYASLEGAEAAAYQRGTATLSNGQAIVTFPEHYQIVANPNSMTVILTPLDASSNGLAVIEKTETGFTVKELAKGTGNYSFDWEVKCVRKGHEGYRVIRDASECQPSKAPTTTVPALNAE